ncbi:MAG: PAS domain-containing protein [Gammaproteobacteria bacterium]
MNRQSDANLERLELAAEAAGIGFWEWDLLADRLIPDSFLSARFGMGLRSGCPPAEEFEQLLHPDDLAGFLAAVGRAFKSTERTHHRCRMLHLDGNIRFIDAHLKVSRDKLGKPMRMLGMLKDVTADVEAARQLEATRDHELRLLERLSVAIQAAGLQCWEFSYLEESFTWVDSLPDGVDPRTIGMDEVNRGLAGSAIAEDAESIRLETVRALAAGAQTLSSRMRRRLPDGRILHFQIYQRFFRDDNGRPVRSLGATRDVTDEVFAEEMLRIQKDELQTAQKRLERASSSVQEGHWEIDLVARRHWASSNYYTLLGFSPLERRFETVESVQALIHPDDFERATRAARAHLLGNEPHDLELRIRCKDGAYRWFRMRGRAERDADGVALRVSGSIHEIDRQKAAEDALREAQARFERAIEGTQDGLWEVDVTRGKMWLSPRLHELLGYRVGELDDRHDVMRELLHPGDLVASDAQVARQFEHGKSVEFEARMRCKSGEYRWFRLRGSPSSDGGNAFTRVSGSMQDVTEARIAKDALVRASEEAQSANQAKSAFLANMSHEIRTPMNGILGMTTLLLDTALAADQREYAETIHSSSQSLLTVINDILDFSKIEAGKLDIESIEMDVRRVVDDVIATLDYQAQAKGLKLVIDVQADVPRVSMGDPQRIRQCLINLMGNAIKFTHSGQVHVSASGADVCDGRTLVRFEVRDTGIGIAPESVKSLFQPFVQADSSTTRHFGGTGLGLSIVRGLVEMMGGQVGAHSQPGNGSTFWFVLPMMDVSATSPRADKPAKDAHWASRRFRGKVLLVEDNAVNQKVAQRFLERLGCEVELVENGEQCLHAWERGHFDVVLMDIQMPVMDGYTATRLIREKECVDRHTPIVALTANAMTGQLERCLSAGMDGLLTKPIAIERLREVLDRLGLAVPADEVLAESEVAGMMTAPAQPPAVDTSQLSELAGEDQGFVQSVVLSFEKSMAQLLATMHAAASRGEAQQLARAAHQVKGAAANLHATALSALAADIEASAKTMSLAQIQERLNRLALEIGRATAALQNFAAARDVTARSALLRALPSART